MDPSQGRVKTGWPARTYIQQLCEDTGFSPEDLPEAMNDWEEAWEGQAYPCWRHDIMMMMPVNVSLELIFWEDLRTM